MDELLIKIKEFENKLDRSLEQIGLAQLSGDLKKLTDNSKEPNFWSDNQKAQIVMKRISSLEKRIGRWESLKQDLDDLRSLANTDDDSLKEELGDQLDNLAKRYNDIKSELRLSGPHDNNEAIMTISAGAGGTDAQDWAEMLMRMYLRFAEKNEISTELIDSSNGETAGIKSATIVFAGDFAYGKLKSEHGVHRLVRLSPYNADSLRQTSFAKVEVIPKIESDQTVKIDDKDLKIDVFRSGGKGGQSVNTTDSAVRITHIPTGIVVSIQNERSQLQNRETALTILKSKLGALQQQHHQDNISKLKGPNTSAEWGNQIRSYVLHPYKLVKDLRTKEETNDVNSVLDGGIERFIDAYLEDNISA